MRHARWLLVAVMLLSFSSLMFAASQNAVIYGEVYDAAGAPMAGTTIELKNDATGWRKTVITGSDGSYNIPEVPPNSGYTLTASKDGVVLDVRTGIVVNVGDERVILPPLQEKAKPAATATTPTTTGGETTPTPAPTETRPTGPQQTVFNDTAVSVSTVVTRDQLATLPLYNRNFLALGLLVQGVKDVEAGSPLTGSTFAIAGVRPSSNNFLLNGADNVASSSNQAIPFQVNDAIQEFRVIITNANAEYGRNQGGVVNVVTRSGDNRWHGGGFGYFATDAVNSDGPLSVYKGSGFDRAAAYAGSTNATSVSPFTVGAPVAVSTFNQYVATAANRGYCTSSLTVATTAPAGLSNCATLTTAYRNAGFITNAQSVFGKNVMFDPATILATYDKKKLPFDSNQFGASLGGPISKDKLFFYTSYEGTRIDNPNPVFERVPTDVDRTYASPTGRNPRFAATDQNYLLAQSVLNLYPKSNVVAVPGVLEFFQGQADNYTRVHNLLSRIDYRQSEKSNWSFSYTGQLLKQLHDGTLPSSTAYPGNGAFRDAANQNASISWTRSFGKLTNDAKGGFTRFQVLETPQDQRFDASTLGLTSPIMPTFQLSGIDSRTSGAAPNLAGTGGVLGATAGWFDTFWAYGTTNLPAGPNVVCDPLNPAKCFTKANAPIMPTLDSLFPMARLGAPISAPSARRDTQWFFADSISTSWGKHKVKFGGEVRYLENKVTQAGFTRGLVTSGNIGQFTHDANSCNGVSDAATNTICSLAFTAPSFDSATRQATPLRGLFNSIAASGFFQDGIRIGKVSLNFGVRYEYFSTPEEDGNNLWNYDPQVNGLVQQTTNIVTDPFGNGCHLGTPHLDSVYRDNAIVLPWNCQSLGRGKFLRVDKNNIAPRAGFAWNVTPNTVVRAAFGMFYDQLPLSYVSQLMFNRPTPLNFANPQAIYGQNFFNTGIGTGWGQCFLCGLGNTQLNTAPVRNIGGNSNQSFMPLSARSAAMPFAMYSRDFTTSTTPYTQQMSFSVQHQLGPNVAMEVGYMGVMGKDQPVVANSGFANQWFCTASSTATTALCDANSFFPIYTMYNKGKSEYHSAVVRIRGAQFHGIRFNAAYTFAKGMDNASAGTFPLVTTPLFTQLVGLQFWGLGNPLGVFIGNSGTAFGNRTASSGLGISAPAAENLQSSLTTTGARPVLVSPYNISQSVPLDPKNPDFSFLRDEWGRSDFDISHRFVLDYSIDMDTVFANLKKNRILGGFQLSGIVAAQSGQPFTIFAGPIFGEVTQRVDTTGPVVLTGDPNGYFKTSTLSLPGIGCAAGTSGSAFVDGVKPFGGKLGTPCTGDSRRNQFVGPNFISVDMSLQKNIHVGAENRVLSFRGEVFNLLNRANYYNPISAMSLDGATINPDFGVIKSAHDPRQFQFAVRFAF